jgi:hypothetical protein
MRLRTLAAAGGVAVLLAGCGGSTAAGERTGAEVATDAAEAVASAGSVHVTGAITYAGVAQHVDLHLQDDDLVGTISTGGEDVDLVVAGGSTHMRAGADFWADHGLPPEIVPDLDGSWVLMPAEAAAEFGAFTLDGLVEQLADADGLEEEVRSEQRDGVPVLVVTHADGGTLTVEAHRPGFPLVLHRDRGATQRLEYSRFGELEDITAPVDVVDLAEYAA